MNVKVANEFKKRRSYEEYIPYFKDNNYTNAEIAKILGVSKPIVTRMRQRYHQEIKDNKYEVLDEAVNSKKVMTSCLLSNWKLRTAQDNTLDRVVAFVNEYLNHFAAFNTYKFKGMELKIAKLLETIENLSDEIDTLKGDEKKQKEIELSKKEKELNTIKQNYHEEKLKVYYKYIKQANFLLNLQPVPKKV